MSALNEFPQFPTMLRKMWTGEEVQRWIDDCQGRQLDLATGEEIEYATEQFAQDSEDTIRVDTRARVSRANEGVWVEAWVWLPNEES